MTGHKPFLKWAGGKRWLAKHLCEAIPTGEKQYCEPFLGGGSMFFAIKPSCASLSDLNEDLINTYEMVKENPYGVIAQLQMWSIDKETFSKVRKESCGTQIYRAARLIYLNKTAYNGLYRTNKLGEFNVPFGCKANTVLIDEDILVESSKALQKASLSSGSFFTSENRNLEDCLYFIDPPYVNKRKPSESFIRYGHKVFSWNDQVDLAILLNEMVENSSSIVLTNTYQKDVAKLYCPKRFVGFVVKRGSSMAAARDARGMREEILIISRDIVKATGGRAEFIRKLGIVSCRNTRLG